MTRHGPALLALSVLAIAGWTYNVNYDTRAALDRISELRGRIADTRESLQVLRVEWAYLNNPDRLARLVARYDDRLALVAMTPQAFGRVAAVPYPPDLPRDPAPEPPQSLPPELLVAAAPPVEPGGVTVAEGQDGLLATADEVATDTAAVALAGAEASGAAGSGFLDASDSVRLAARAAASEKAAELTDALTAAPGTPDPPTTMREAVTLALIEAGIVVPGAASPAASPAASASAALIRVSAEPGVPVPLARPAIRAAR